MSKIPKISVLMPNYNGSKYISDAIESILTQNFLDFEFIIIDDCSTDDSWKIIQKYAKNDKRIIALRNNKNLKICKTLNKGLAIAKGEYIARMDSDDISLVDRFQKQITFLEKNEGVGLVGGHVKIIDKNGKEQLMKKFPIESIKEQIWYRNPFVHPGVLIRKKCFEDFGGYDEQFLYAEDLELWIRFGKKWDFGNLNEIVLKYRIFGENTTLKKQKKMIHNTLKARRKAIKLGYKIPIKGRFFYLGTWCMQFLPPKIVLGLFNIIQKIGIIK